MKTTALILTFLLFTCAPLLKAQEDEIPLPGGLKEAFRNTWHATADDNGEGVFFVAWAERSRAGSRIRGSFLENGQRSGFTAIDISEPPPGCEDVRPSVACLNRDTLLVAWQRGGDQRQILLLRLLHRESGIIGEELPLSDSDSAAMLPELRRVQGGAIAAWQDFRNRNLDIRIRKIDETGTPSGPGFLLNDDSTEALQGQPRLSLDNRDKAIVVWSDNRVDGFWKFYYRQAGERPEGKNVLLDSAQRKAMTTLASVVWMSRDTAVFTWKDYREGHSNIYRRIVLPASGVQTPAQRINDDTGEQWQRLPVIDGDCKGNVVMCWEDYRNTETNQRGDIYMQVFARDASLHGPNQRVNDREDRIARKVPVLVMGSDGVYIIVWHQGDEGEFNLAGQWFRYPDERIGENFCITCNDGKR